MYSLAVKLLMAICLLAICVRDDYQQTSKSLVKPSHSIAVSLKATHHHRILFTLITSKPANAPTCLLIILLVSGDIETNPGPGNKSIFPCGYCDKPVNWSQRGVACDECDHWYHKSCIEMCTRDFDQLNLSNVSWMCCRCHTQNIPSFTFHLYELATSNQYDQLSRSHIRSQSRSPAAQITPTAVNFKPTNFSSPKSADREAHPSIDSIGSQISSINRSTESQSSSMQISNTPTRSDNTESHQGANTTIPPKSNNWRTLVMNGGGMKGKTPQFRAALDYYKPDCILGCETWLDNSVKDSEIFPENFNIYRKDRNIHGGGVYIAIDKKYTSAYVEEGNTDCEAIWASVATKDAKFYVGSYYRPPDEHRSKLSELNKSLHQLPPLISRQTQVARW